MIIYAQRVTDVRGVGGNWSMDNWSTGNWPTRNWSIGSICLRTIGQLINYNFVLIDQLQFSIDQLQFCFKLNISFTGNKNLASRTVQSLVLNLSLSGKIELLF